METVSIGGRIRAAREAAGLTQGELAARVGVATSGICRYEYGGSVTVERARDIATALGMTLSELVDEVAR